MRIQDLVTEHKDNMADFIAAMEDFLPLVMKELELESLPTIKLKKYIKDSEQPTFGKYVNDKYVLFVGIKDRHIIDVLRTIAHELVHYKQDIENRLHLGAGETGSDIENEANKMAGIIMRKFNKAHRHYFEKPALDLMESKRKKKKKRSQKRSPTFRGLYGYYGDFSDNSGGDAGGDVAEAWSKKYKKSINCKNPKGFSQRAHCQGRKKKVSESTNKDQKSFNKVIFLNDKTAIVGIEHGQLLKLPLEIKKKVKKIADDYGAWYEGSGGDNKNTKGIIDQYHGSWDEDLLSSLIKDYPSIFLYVMFSNIKVNNTIEKIGINPNSTIFDLILEKQSTINYFPERKFDAGTLREFLKSISEDTYDFVKMSEQPATKNNVTKFFKLGEKLMWPDNWEEYPNRAGKVAKSANDLRDQFLVSRKSGVYVTGEGHLVEIEKLFKKQNVDENFADGKKPGRKGLSKRVGIPKKATLSQLEKIAKTSTGERRRMAQWQLNMRRGRKKKK